MLDIDAFKTINDTYGHATGDQSLQDMGKLLYRVAMDYQAMAVRFGGDEFILLRTVAKREEMLQVSRRSAAQGGEQLQRQEATPLCADVLHGNHGISGRTAVPG